MQRLLLPPVVWFASVGAMVILQRIWPLATLPPDACVLADGLSQAQIAALQYHGALTLVRSGGSAGTDCQSMVVAPASQATLHQRVELTHWAFKSTVSRLTDSKESLLVYLRVGN